MTPVNHRKHFTSRQAVEALAVQWTLGRTGDSVRRPASRSRSFEEW
ncbi:unnamed protein product, partial [Pylaiella littoralis]